jgi:hypothetical protein
MADKDEKKPFALRLSKEMMENIEKWAADDRIHFKQGIERCWKAEEKNYKQLTVLNL